MNCLQLPFIRLEEAVSWTQEKNWYSLLDTLIWTTIKQWKLFQICISNIFHTLRF